MSNLDNNAAINGAQNVNGNSQLEKQADDDALIDKLQELQDKGTLESISPLGISRLANDFGVSEKQVRYSIKLILQTSTKSESTQEKDQTLNGNCGYYYGNSKVARSEDSMDNMVNQANWNRMMFNIR